VSQAPQFLTQAFDVELLDAEPCVVAVLDANGTIVWVNKAWSKFAAENDGAAIDARFGVGTRYLDGISGPLKQYYASVFEHVLRTGEPFEQDYECSSPEIFRRNHLRIFPVGDAGLLLEHCVATSHPHGGEERPVRETDFRDVHGLVLQCSNCRRVHQRGDGWHWIPEWIKTPPSSTSHGLCAVCAGHYFAAARRARLAARAKKDGGTV
jgi:hypothetical protein